MAQRELVVKILGDSKSLERAFNRSSRSAKGFQRDVGNASRGALAATLSFKGLTRSLALGSTTFLGGAGVGFIGKQLIDQASRVQEEVEKSGVVFGKNAQQVEAWSKTLAQSFGVSTGAALEATGKFGNMLRPLGFGTAAAAKMSERLVELAADMASFNNTKPDVVLEALSSGLAGQVRPLRQFGVFLSQARIQTEAAQDGIAKMGAKLTQGQKVQAAYNIILKDTKNAQGDVARNTGSLSVALSKFQAGTQDLEAALGSQLLPTLTKYVNKADVWLNNTQNQERLQRQFATAVRDTSAVIGTTANVVKKVTGALGGMKDTLELLLALKVGSVATRWAGDFGLIGSQANTAAKNVGTLRGRLAGLAGLKPIAITIVITEIIQHKKGIVGFARDNVPGFAKLQDWEFKHDPAARALDKFFGVEPDQFKKKVAALKPSPDIGFRDVKIPAALDDLLRGGNKRGGLTAAQRNTFFDSALARSLDRVQDLGLKQQLSRLGEISKLISDRLKVTKDITRKLNLEDQLVQVGRQAKGVRQEIAQNVKDRIDAQNARAKEVVAIKLAQRTARQFRELGLNALGEERTPGVAGLSKRLQQLTGKIAGTNLDTPKLQAQLARFRKVLSEGLVPKDVRARIKEMMDGIADELKNSGRRNATKFSHANSNVVLAGLGLSPDQIRVLRGRLSQIGAGGTIPGARSQAFSGAGAGGLTVNGGLHLHGIQNVRELREELDKIRHRTSGKRRSTYAGHH